MNYQKNYMKIVVAQLIAVVLAGIFLFCSFKELRIDFGQEEMLLQTLERTVQEGSYTDVSYTDIKGVVSPEFGLKKGIYNIEFSYETNGIVKAGLIYDVLHKSREMVNDNEFVVNSDKTKMNYTVQINDTSEMRFRLRLTGDAVEGNYINLETVSITLSKLTCIRQIVSLILLFIVCDLLALLLQYYRKCSQVNKTVILILCCTAFVMGLPLYQNGLVDGADLRFHLWRIEGLYEGLLSGQFPVKIQPGWLDGYGYSVSVFYGDVLLYFPALLRMAGFAIEEAYKIFIVTFNVATVFISFWSFKKISQNDLAALAGTVLYVGSIEHLYRLYSASMTGMFCAMTFYPVVLLALYLLFSEDIETPEYKKIWIYLVIGFSGLLMTHIISCLMVGIFTILACVICFKRLIRKNTLIELGKALAAGVMVNLWFLVPFVDYAFTGNTRIFSNVLKTDEVDYYVELASFMKNSRAISDLFLELSEAGQGLGYALTFVVIAYVVSIPWQEKEALVKKSGAIFGFALIGMWFCSNLFPAVEVAKISRVFLKVFQTIQHQHRFLGIAAVLLSCLAALLLSMSILEKKHKFAIVIMLAFFVMYQNVQYFSTLDIDGVYLDKVDLESKVSKDMLAYGIGNGEYIPAETDVTLIKDEIIFDESQLDLEGIERSYLDYEITAKNLSGEQQTILLPLLFYKGYNSQDLYTGEGLETASGDNGRVEVSIPANYEGTLTVGFSEPWYWRVAEIISLIALAGIILYIRKNRRNCDGHSCEKRRTEVAECINLTHV